MVCSIVQQSLKHHIELNRSGLSGEAGAGFSRLARQAEFDGEIQPGAEYVMVDDFIGMGGTLANLRGHIETHGGKVLAAVALTGKPHSAKLGLTQSSLDELRGRHGTELEHWYSVTPSTRLLNQKLGILSAPRMLQPSEIVLLRQSKQAIAHKVAASAGR